MKLWLLKTILFFKRILKFLIEHQYLQYISQTNINVMVVNPCFCTTSEYSSMHIHPFPLKYNGQTISKLLGFPATGDCYNCCISLIQTCCQPVQESTKASKKPFDMTDPPSQDQGRDILVLMFMSGWM